MHGNIPHTNTFRHACRTHINTQPDKHNSYRYPHFRRMDKNISFYITVSNSMKTMCAHIYDTTSCILKKEVLDDHMMKTLTP